MRFIDNNDGTITDTKTNLMWQKTDDGIRRNWQDAKEYTKELRLGDYIDWRLPTIEELTFIIDYKKYNLTIDSIFDCQHSSYWSDSSIASNILDAWVVYFSNGSVNWSTKTLVHSVRYVRDIPLFPSNTLYIRTEGNVGISTTGFEVSSGKCEHNRLELKGTRDAFIDESILRLIDQNLICLDCGIKLMGIPDDVSRIVNIEHMDKEYCPHNHKYRAYTLIGRSICLCCGEKFEVISPSTKLNIL